VRILVAEDDRSLREVLQRGLLEAGYVVDVVAMARPRPPCSRRMSTRSRSWTGACQTQRHRGARHRTKQRRHHADPGLDRPRRGVGSVEGLNTGADDYLVKPSISPNSSPAPRPCKDDRAGVSTRRSAARPAVHSATRELHGADTEIDLTSTERLIIELLLAEAPPPYRANHRHSRVDDQADVVGSNTIESTSPESAPRSRGAREDRDDSGFGYRWSHHEDGTSDRIRAAKVAAPPRSSYGSYVLIGLIFNYSLMIT